MQPAGPTTDHLEIFSSFSPVLKQILSPNFKLLLRAAQVASPVVLTGTISLALQANRLCFLLHTLNQNNGPDLEPPFVTSPALSFFTLCSSEGRAAEAWRPNDSSPKFQAHPHEVKCLSFRPSLSLSSLSSPFSCSSSTMT